LTNTTAENLADFILSEFIKKNSLSKNVKRIELGVDEGFGQGAWVEKIIG